MNDRTEQDNKNMNDLSQESLIKMIDDQLKELKLTKKKLSKLEEKYIKINSDYRLLMNDKTSIENFLKIIFPKEMHEGLIKSEIGLYDTNELNRFWVVVEGSKNNDYQKFLSQLKSENAEFSKRNENLRSELDLKNEELETLRISESTTKECSLKLATMYNEITRKHEAVENERQILLSLIEEKDSQIEKLSGYEIECAELKAKLLLESFNNKKEESGSNGSNSNIFKIKNFNVNQSIIANKNNEKCLNITSIASGTQTTEKIFCSSAIEELEKEINGLKKINENLKKEFQEFREKSNKIIFANEGNYLKLHRENESNKQIIENFNKTNEKPRNTQGTQQKTKEEIIDKQKAMNHYTHLNPNMSIQEIDSQIINIEYLKNVLIKYLEGIANGDEFQIKILENVMFAILNISEIEKAKLEDKRARSWFYYNLWYNAKQYFTEKIYGNYDPIDSNINELNDTINKMKENKNPPVEEEVKTNQTIDELQK